MKTKIILFTVIAILLLIGVGGCENESTDNDVKSIIGTWKLEGFGNTSNKSFKDANPKDCEECFVITFNVDNTFTGKTTTNTLWSKYILSDNKLSFPNGISTTKIYETGDGAKFTESLRFVSQYSFEKSKLRLFYSETEYLLFHSIL